MRKLVWAVPLPVALGLLWHLAVDLEWITIIPKPSEVALETWDFAFGGIYDNAFSATFLLHLGASAGRVLTGFLWATAAGVGLGILLGRGPRLSALVEPVLNMLRPIPVTAWVPLVIIVFGIGSKSAIILIFIAAFYPILLNTMAGVKSVPPRLLEAAAMLGTRSRQMLTKVVLPAALPSIFTGMRIALGFSWVVLVVGETVGITTGLGAVITNAHEISNTKLIIAGMVFIGVAGLISDRAMSWLIRVSLRNRPIVQT